MKMPAIQETAPQKFMLLRVSILTRWPHMSEHMSAHLIEIMPLHMSAQLSTHYLLCI